MENIDFDFTNKEVHCSGRAQKSADAGLSPLGPNANLSTSGILHRGDEIAVCVMIEDGDRSAEYRLTAGQAGEVLMSRGYTDEENAEIMNYLDANINDIVGAAREVNPMKAFMK